MNTRLTIRMSFAGGPLNKETKAIPTANAHLGPSVYRPEGVTGGMYKRIGLTSVMVWTPTPPSAMSIKPKTK